MLDRKEKVELPTMLIMQGGLDDNVIPAIQGGGYGRIAVTYLEWADGDFQRVVAPWTVALVVH